MLRYRSAARWSALALVVACSAAASNGGSMGPGGANPNGAPDGGNVDPSPDTKSIAPRCEPCVGHCVGETLRKAGASDGIIATAGGHLFHSGPGRQQGSDVVASNELFFGETSLLANDKKIPMPAELNHMQLVGRGDTVAAFSWASGLDPQSKLLLLDGATGTARHTIDLQRFNAGDRNANAVSFAITSTGVYHLETEERDEGQRLTSVIYFAPYDTGEWQSVLEEPHLYDQIAADETGAYFLTDRGLEHADLSGTRTVIASHAALGLEWDVHSYDSIVVGKDVVYLAGGYSFNGRTCQSTRDQVYSVVFAVPKHGGAPRRILFKPISKDVPALQVRGGDDRGLVLIPLPGCVLPDGSEPGTNVWLLSPDDGALEPLFAEPTPVLPEIAVDDSFVTFVQTPDRHIARACRVK